MLPPLGLVHILLEVGVSSLAHPFFKPHCPLVELAELAANVLLKHVHLGEVVFVLFQTLSHVCGLHPALRLRH